MDNWRTVYRADLIEVSLFPNECLLASFSLFRRGGGGFQGGREKGRAESPGVYTNYEPHALLAMHFVTMFPGTCSVFLCCVNVKNLSLQPFQCLET